MKFNSWAYPIITFFILLFNCSLIFSQSEDDILKLSIEPAINKSGEGLCYAVFGQSVISQGKLYTHSAIDIDNIPKDAKVLNAVLYWAGEVEPYKSADTKIELTDPAGKIININAEKIWTTMISGLVYVSKADVTQYIKANGKYKISYIDADHIEPAEIKGKIIKNSYYTLGGWGLIVIYKDPEIKTISNIQLYDGMLYVTTDKYSKGDRASLKIGEPISVEPDAVDIATISGFGKPWDGGSITFDEASVSGKEYFAGNAGFSWDINRDLVFLDGHSRKKQHVITFMPDYNNFMIMAVIAKFGKVEQNELLKLADSYIAQSSKINASDFLDLRTSESTDREFMLKNYIREILDSKAIALVEKIKNLNSAADKTYEFQMVLGKLYLEQNKLDLAEMIFKELMNAKKNDYLVCFNLSQVYYKKRDLDNAIFYLTKAKETSPNNAIVLLNLGICLSQKGSFAEATNQFEELIRLDPNNLTPYYCLYNIYERQNDEKKKITILKQIDERKRDEQK